jgi:hypothetical protein
MKADLEIFPKSKTAYIDIYDITTGCTLSTIKLEYSDDKKELELQVLLHGYTILKLKYVSCTTYSYRIVYDLEHI